jgi:hypothetical protein
VAKTAVFMVKYDGGGGLRITDFSLHDADTRKQASADLLPIFFREKAQLVLVGWVDGAAP